MNLMQLVQGQAAAILDEAGAAVERARLPHYEQAGRDVARGRLRALYEAMQQSLERRQLDPIRAHAEAVAQERFRSGFDLGEVQTAFNVLEEALWKRVTGELPPEQLAEALGLVSTVLGAGKDALGRTYVALATRTQVPTLNLEAMFRGAAPRS